MTQKYLSSEYSVAEARILYEIYDNERISATEIVSRLHVDKGYLSRILKKFETKALVTRTASKSDSRKAMISLTDTGWVLAEKLIPDKIDKAFGGGTIRTATRCRCSKTKCSRKG